MQHSSYLNPVDFGDIISAITMVIQPTKIVEFGILNGFSLQAFADYSDCTIDAYDIFDDFVGNCANEALLKKRFQKFKNIHIKKGDFYEMYDTFENESIDIIHIDIANTGETYAFAIEHYLKKIKNNGVMILEGGSKERDDVSWMMQYNKQKIQPLLQTFNLLSNVIDKFPSMTIIRPTDLI
jgi:predicted O-methyltransferase YrrM